MKIKNKIKVIKSYGLYDLIDKFKNYPKNFYKRKSNVQLRNNLLESVNNCLFPSINEYEKKMDKRVIISVTSFPKRFNQLVLTLKSIILQDVVPNKIIVYFGSDTSENDITKNMKELKKYGVEYRFDKENNLKGHKKYYYALREFKDYLVITIDDDIIFPKTMISELLQCYDKFPNAVCARRVHKITKKNNTMLSYNLWDIDYSMYKKPSNRLFATTGAGTLYSPNVINKLVYQTFDSNKIKELCLEADDVWMKCMEIMSSIKVVLADIKIMGVFIDVDEEYTLMPENVGNGKNDVFLKNVIKEYNIDLDLFIND